jgi:stress-induced morphogen
MTPEQIKNRLEQIYSEAASAGGNSTGDSTSKIEVLDLTGTQDHYQVYVESEKFRGLSRMQQHRAVMDVFDPELKSGEVHALTIRTAIPETTKQENV